MPLSSFFRRSSRRSRLNRIQSPTRILLTPYVSVMLASMVTALPIILDRPVLPPLGLMLFIAWRLLRSDSFHLWAGFPLGVWDDLFSGQPFGTAVISWSLFLLLYEGMEARIRWSNYWTNWLLGSLVIAIVLFFGLFTVSLVQPAPDPRILLPQIAISILLFPLIQTFVARLDRWRFAA